MSLLSTKLTTSPVAAIIWAVVYSFTLLEAVQLIFLMIFRDFRKQTQPLRTLCLISHTPLLVLMGVIVATFLWYVSSTPCLHSLKDESIPRICRFFSNRVLLSPPSHSTPADSSVEWSYALDVHINAFFPLYLTLYLAQLFLLPIILKDNWVCLWVGNTLYLAACVSSLI